MTEATALALLVGTLCGTGFGILIGLGINLQKEDKR